MIGVTLFKRLILFVFLLSLSICGSAQADDTFEDILPRLAQGSFADKEQTLMDLAATADKRAVALIRAFTDGRVFASPDGSRIVIMESTDDGDKAVDPITNQPLTEDESFGLKKVVVNNMLRRAAETALGQLTLGSPDSDLRLEAAASIFANRDPAVLPVLEKALEAEKDPVVRRVMNQARAAIVVTADFPVSEKLTAIDVLTDRGDRDALAIVSGLTEHEEAELAKAAQKAAKHIETTLSIWNAAQNVWYGISLGSVLLLAAVGLAITFGVMGVINMAHGEMVMIGAYTTFVVQDIIRQSAPGLFEYSLLIALPIAFLFAGLLGIAIERGIIRWLYGRPLETLLATWGLSLILQQATRTIFGPSNQEVGAPEFMSGAFQLGHLSITYGRLWIVVFSLTVFAVLLLVLKRSSFGLQMRAVTQNRPMASAMGVKTPWVDALTFGLGSGIAGIAGVALSQIDNVSPNLGQNYIIDSFMVVVFGGVGNLWGTLVGAFSLGIVNKFLEPYAGAVLGKILVLVFIILFIQKKPRGLFALKGRFVES